MFLYPVVGILLDRLPPIGVFQLLLLSSACTMTTGQILNSVKMTSFVGPLASVLPFAVGYGYAPVVIVIVSVVL